MNTGGLGRTRRPMPNGRGSRGPRGLGSGAPLAQGKGGPSLRGAAPVVPALRYGRTVAGNLLCINRGNVKKKYNRLDTPSEVLFGFRVWAERRMVIDRRRRDNHCTFSGRCCLPWGAGKKTSSETKVVIDFD